ncbi:hypothetical protein ABPG74_000377 [Tetrahymena malaccensis]
MNGADGHFNLLMYQRNHQFNEGLKLMSQGDFAGAQFYFKLILNNVCGDIQARFQLARCYQFCENYQSALLAYEEVFKRNTKDPRPVYQQGYIYDKNNQLDIAIQYYEKAAQILANNKSEFKNDTKINIIYYTLGLKYEQINEIEKAKRAFQTFIQFNNISDMHRQLANQKLKDLSNKILDGSLTQSYKSKINQAVRQQQPQQPSVIKYQQSIKEEEERKNIINMPIQLEIAKSQNLYQLNLQQIKEENENKKEQRKPGDSNISQPSTADKHPSINNAQNLNDENSLNIKINQQIDSKLIATSLNQLNINNICLPHQNNINTTTHNNIPQNTHQQKNFPPQQIQNNSKINSTNQQNSSHQCQQQNKINTYHIKQQQFKQIQQVFITSDQLLQPSQSLCQDKSGVQAVANIPHNSVEIKQSYQLRKNRVTFDPSSSSKDIFTSSIQQNNQQENAQNNPNKYQDQYLQNEDDYDNILNEEDILSEDVIIPDEKIVKQQRKSYKYLHPIEDDQEELSDEDIPSENGDKIMQNKSSFNNPNQIKNIFMKSFIDVAQKSNSKSRISGQSHLSNSRFSVLQEQSTLLKKNNVT